MIEFPVSAAVTFVIVYSVLRFATRRARIDAARRSGTGQDEEQR